MKSFTGKRRFSANKGETVGKVSGYVPGMHYVKGDKVYRMSGKSKKVVSKLDRPRESGYLYYVEKSGLVKRSKMSKKRRSSKRSKKSSVKKGKKKSTKKKSRKR